MNDRLQRVLISLVSFALGLSLQVLAKGNCTEEVMESSYAPKPAVPAQPSQAVKPTLTEAQLHQHAKSITVKVLSGLNSGSGILIHQQGQVYTVLTNQHVLLFGEGKSYRIETPDGQTYPANLTNSGKFDHQDLGLLQFRSDGVYAVASLSWNSKPLPGEDVVAAGFPLETSTSQPQGFVSNKGKIAVLNPQAFGGGYQIGYTNAVKKGMSGGPLLNRQGQVIGINGIHKYPLWGNPYVFEDGHTASSEEKKLMSQLSWAIPVQTFLQLMPQFTAREDLSPTSYRHW